MFSDDLDRLIVEAIRDESAAWDASAVPRLHTEVRDLREAALEELMEEWSTLNLPGEAERSAERMRRLLDEAGEHDPEPAEG